MSLAFVSDFFSPSIGGTQILAQDICEGFRDRGYEVEVITTPDEKRDPSKYDYKINEVENLDLTKSNIFYENRYDAVFVLADLFSPSLATINTGLVEKSILILNLDENVYRWVNEGRIKNLDFLIKKIKSFTHVVSFCQGAPVNNFLDENNIEYHFIPNFTRDCSKTDKPNIDLKKTLGIEDKKIIFNHGLIEDRKNQLYLCKKFAETSLLDDHVLVLLGSPRGNSDISYLSKINNFIKDNNLSESIKLIKGTTNKGLIDKILESSDIYVLPSKAEGLPLVLLEAMSSGLPWVSTPVGGVPSVLGTFDCGIVLNSVHFSSEELEDSIRGVSDRNSSRKYWEENFTKEIAITNYQNILDISLNYNVEREFLKKVKISFANQVYNEPEAIAKYLRSCLQFAEIVDEVYVINHRSSDNTLEVIESFKDTYEKVGISLKWRTEKRDFSKDYTIADLFGAAVAECNNEIVFRHDADFIFGPGYLKTMFLCCEELSSESVYACGYEIPIVRDQLVFEDGKVLDYGYCGMHVAVPRVFKKTKTICKQNHVNGKYEWFHPTERSCSKWTIVPHVRESLLSVDIKLESRHELRKSMNTFMQDIQNGKVFGNWLDCENLRKEVNQEDWDNLKQIDIISERYSM